MTLLYLLLYFIYPIYLRKSSHHERIAVIMLQGNACSPYHTLQWIVCHMNRELDLCIQSFIQSPQQSATTCYI